MDGNLEEKKFNANKSLVKMIRGFPFPNLPNFKDEIVGAAMDQKPRDGDVVLHSYPKTGNHWLTFIIWLILHNGEHYPVGNVKELDAPMQEVTGIEHLEKVKGTRFYRTHLPFNMVKKNDCAKYIYIHRNPFDMYLSYFHFINDLFGRSHSWKNFLELLTNSGLPYGDYFDHVMSFYSCRSYPNLLIVSYEDLHKDKRGQIMRIAKFLGEEYHDSLLKNEDMLRRIDEVTDFDYMKKCLFVEIPFPSGTKKLNFFRKGLVRDGERSLPKNIFDEIHKMLLNKMKGTEYIQIWSTAGSQIDSDMHLLRSC